MKTKKELKNINQSKHYEPSEKKIVSTTLQKLKTLVKFTEKYETLKYQIQKIKQDKQCTQDEKQILQLSRLIEELEQKLNLMTDEMQTQNFDFENIKIQMLKIDEIVNSIEPLFPSEQNEKKIHKQLKNLNRFEEHLLIIKTRTSNQELKQMISQIMQKVIDKKQAVLSMITNQPQPGSEGLFNQQLQQDQDPSCQQYGKKQFYKTSQLIIQNKNLQKSSCQLQKKQLEIIDETPTELPIEEDKKLKINQEINQEQNLKNNINVKKQNEETPTALPEEKIIFKDKSLLNEKQIKKGQKNTDNEIQSEQEKNEDLQEHEKCQICLDKRKKYVAIPCGHFLYCEDCKQLVTDKLQCLVCLQNVYQMVQVFQ